MSEKGTEAGSAQHKKKAREKGDSVRSRELLSAVALLAGVLTLGGAITAFTHGWRAVFEQCLDGAGIASVRDADYGSDRRWIAAVNRTLEPAVVPIGIVMLTSFAGALAVGIAQGGGLEFHPNAIGVKLEKLNPATNIANLFSLRGATRLAKSLVPASAMVLLGWSAVKALMLPMPVMSMTRLPLAFSTSYRLALDAACLTLAWSGLDYLVEWMAWNKRMMMTKQQLKDEMKDSMGNPQVKGRIRQVQNLMRRRRVKADLSRASVVITNPTHYAVALEFSFETMLAPTVLAKGRDLHAAEIREEARWAGVPIIENPPLARSLYRAVEPGQSIPFDLYATVASILAFLYRQKVEEKIREQKRQEQQRANPAPPPPTTPGAYAPPATSGSAAFGGAQ
jgi:flagellar biosynthetic protein FlhB